MTDFFSRLESELVEAAERRRARPWWRRLPGGLPRPRRSAALAFAGVVAIAVPAGAAVTGAWDPTPAEPAPDAGIVAEPGEPLAEPGAGALPADPLAGSPPAAARAPGGDTVVVPPSGCSVRGSRRASLSEAPPSEALLDLLGVLRRPRRAGDRPPPRFRDRPGVDGIHADHMRLARTTPSGGRYYLIPAENVRHVPELADTPACRRLERRRPQPRPQAGVCLAIEGDGGGGTCQTASAIRRGLSLLTGDRVPGQRRGTVNVAMIVPDGIERVTLRYPREAPVREVSGEVVGNVFAATFNGSAAVMPRIYWHTRDGVREVGRSR